MIASGKHSRSRVRLSGAKARGRYAMVRVVEHTQRGVEVVIRGIDEVERDHLAPQVRGRLGVRTRVGAETGAGQDDVAEDEEVALTLVDEARRTGIQEAVGLEPAHDVLRLGGTLAGLVPRAEHATVDDQSAVGHEHHVGQPRHRVDDRHVVAECTVGAHELFPLPHGPGGVDRVLGVHPRVDRVDDVEVGGRAQQVGALGRTALGRGVDPPSAVPRNRR